MKELYRLFVFFWIIVTSLLSNCSDVTAQQMIIKEKEADLTNTFGLEKLHLLNQLTYAYLEKDPKKAMKYSKRAVKLAEDIITPSNVKIDTSDRIEKLVAYFQLGICQYNNTDYLDARENFYKARSYAKIINEDRYDTSIAEYLDEIQTYVNQGKAKKGLFKKTFGNLKLGEKVTDASSNLKIQTELKLAKSNEEKQEWRSAIDHYKKAIGYLKNKGESKTVTDLQLKIVSLLDSLNNPHEAQEFLGEAIIESEASLPNIDSTNSVMDNPIQSPSNSTISPPAKVTSDILSNQRNELKTKAEVFAKNKDFKRSLEYYKLYQDLTNRMTADSLQELVNNRDRQLEIKLLRQQKLLADRDVEAIEIENQRQVKLRNYLALGSLLVILSALVTFYFYVSKKREHKKLALAYDKLDETKNKLVSAEEKITNLLRQQVSGDIASELISPTNSSLGTKHFVTIMFLDIRDFTPMAEKMTPEQLIQYQNDIFGFMIDIVQKFHGNINQLLGDGFMATFGAPISHGNDSENAFNAAIDIIEEIEKRNKKGIIQQTKIGIGLHAGDVVTGNVGNEARKQYSVTGNPVIIASRIEQLNKTYDSSLILTEATYNQLTTSVTDVCAGRFEQVKVKGHSTPINIFVATAPNNTHND